MLQNGNMKKYSFYFHYNKPASLKAGSNKLSIHYKGVCHIVDRIICSAPIESKNRKIQPRCVLAGKCEQCWVDNKDSILTGIIN